LWALALVLFSWPFGTAGAVAADPAARGLDVFLHSPDSAAPGAELPVDVLAYGFPDVTRAEPLSGATVEAGWDPEHLGGATAVPASVHATTDAGGRARIAIPMPEDGAGDLELLVGVRSGAHARTRSFKVARVPSSSVELFTTDTRVVPGSTVSAWVRAKKTSNGEPLAATHVRVELQEGGIARHAQEVTTDAGGMAMVRVPIPLIEEVAWHWELVALVADRRGRSATVTLTPREETPGTPVAGATFEAPASGVFAGDRVPWVIRVHDATGQPVPNHEVRWFVGQKGLELLPVGDAKSDKQWLSVSTAAMTDGAGEVHGEAAAPTLVKSQGTALHMVMRTDVEGHHLEHRAEVAVGVVTSHAEVEPEAHVIVPGLSQRLFIRIEDGRGAGVRGPFDVKADGLAAHVTTDENGEAEVTWNVPLGVGATRDVGPCASGVAAAVTIRATQEIAALGRTEPFSLCVNVDREADAIVRAEPLVAHPGDTIKIAVARAPGSVDSKRTMSVIASARDAVQSTSVWLDGDQGEHATQTATMTLPRDAAQGMWDLSAATPEGGRQSRLASTRVFVTPKTLPLVTVKRTGGRAAPLGKIEIEAQLTDGHGKPLTGSVSTVVVDAHGGGSVNVGTIDTRARLCADLGALGRCDAALEGGGANIEALRRELLASNGREPIAPSNDPGAHASKDLAKAFADVLHSLEGALYEASSTPDRLIDARRREHGRWVFNPELFTLVTDAMHDPPLTPGGEALVLPDLVAVDDQVTFDNVARRVTRLKLFKVLAAVRAFRREKQLDPDEPALRDPNALLRRIVRDGRVTPDLLLDPWGGTIQFAKTNGPTVPFMSVARGWELVAPGPDGRVGSVDDVKDPWERVLRSKTPYATAVDEDRLVDSKWDMDVSDATVSGWEDVLSSLTGTSLGNGGLGMSGFGEGGGGRGEGIGLGNVGTMGHGAGRGTYGIATGDAWFSAPVRTDAEGRVKLIIPLGDVETTWRIAFVGVPDAAGPAATTLDVASEMPLSAQVDAGAAWIEGDSVDVRVRVRNRTKKSVAATVDVTADGVAEIDGPKNATPNGAVGANVRVVEVPASGVVETSVRVACKTTGRGVLIVKTRAEGMAPDELRHEWEVRPAGEKRVLTKTTWLEGARSIGIQLDDGYRLRDTPTLVLERGYAEPLAAALDSLEPERQNSPAALVDALDAAKRIERWALSQESARGRALAEIAHAFAARAEGRWRLLSEGTTRSFTENARITALTKGPVDPHAEIACPPAIDATRIIGDSLDPLEVEPPPSPDVPPCWGAFVVDATRLLESADSVRLARAILSLSDRPERAAITATLVERLRTRVTLRTAGDISGPTDRADRTLVYTALLRGVKLGRSAAAPDVLASRIAALRDGTGGYGSAEATLAVVRALLSSQLEGHGQTRARIRVTPSKTIVALDREVDVPENGFVSVPLPANALDVDVDAEGPGVIARLERPVLRLWTRPPPIQSSPVTVEVVWPSEAKAGKTGTLRVRLRHSLSHSAVVDARLPLPPGVTLAAPIDAHHAHGAAAVSQVQGVLAVRWAVDWNDSVMEIPVRFGLGGKFTVPEATARIAKDTYAPAVAPARPFEVR
jgi:hypothetical protein